MGGILKAVPENSFGKTVRQPRGYHAYYPHKLAINGPKGIILDYKLVELVSEVSHILGELSGVIKRIENPDWFIAGYVRKETLLSSQIEGTQCSLEEVFSVNEKQPQLKPVDEVVNYIRAMNLGLNLLKKGLPFSLRLLKNAHKALLSDVRGSQTAGVFKTTQNWIGCPGCNLNEAHFIPTPHYDVQDWMGDLEKYYHRKNGTPFLIKIAILHVYFETIHPFVDGNGSMSLVF